MAVSDSTSKHPVKLSINNQTYTVLVTGDSRDLEEAAHVVDDLVRTISSTRNVDSSRAAVYACLHLADRLRHLERELNSLRNQVDVRTRKIASLLDAVDLGV